MKQEEYIAAMTVFASLSDHFLREGNTSAVLRMVVIENRVTSNIIFNSQTGKFLMTGTGQNKERYKQVCAELNANYRAYLADTVETSDE